MDIGTSKVIAKLKPDYDDPGEYDELVEVWSELCERAQKDVNDELQFADVEKAAIAALSSAPKEQPTGHVGHDISRMLNSFEYPTYLVTSDGYIAGCNLCAWREFNLEVHDSIDQLPFKIDGSEKISQLISKEIRQSDKDPESTLLLKRTHAREGLQDATIAITISYGQAPTALIFVITAKWKPKSLKLLKKQFGLTKAEAAILISFVDGYSSQDIAKQRQRSHQTVRAQFQSIREKMSARNQTELLRTTLSVSNFTREIDEITNAVEHPHRRKSENITLGGRLVEATLMGDFSGDPLVMIAAANLYTFNAEFEKKLYDANLLLISVCPPGYGKTDPAPQGDSRIDVIKDDICSVLDRLCFKKCMLLITYTTAPICYALSRTLPSRFTHIIQINTCGPILDTALIDEQQPTWASGIIRACINNSTIKNILLKGAIKAWTTLGAKQFMRLQMSTTPLDAKYALLPENTREYEHALKTATQLGLSDVVADFNLAFGDWSDDIEATPLNITIIHGRENKLWTIDNVRLLAATFSDKIKLIEIKKAGFTLAQSHPDRVVEILRSVVNSQTADGNLKMKEVIT